MSDSDILAIIYEECEEACQIYGNYNLFVHYNAILAYDDDEHSLLPIR